MCEVTSIHCTVLYLLACVQYNFYVSIYKYTEPTRSSSHTCICACTVVCTYVFIGLCAKRSSNLIAVQRVSTCDSRYIQTLDQYLDRLSDNDSSGRYGQLLQYVCFPGLCAGSLAEGHHPQFMVQKLSTAQSHLGLTACSRAPHSSAQPLPFDHINRCSQTHLPVFPYHLESNIKRGREPELLIKSEKYGRWRGRDKEAEKRD